MPSWLNPDPWLVEFLDAEMYRQRAGYQLYSDFQRGGRSVPLTPALIKGQLYIVLIHSRAENWRSIRSFQHLAMDFLIFFL